jgi:enterochelin esterase-like enzyme
MKRRPLHMAILGVALQVAGCSSDATGPREEPAPDFSGRDGMYTVSSFQSGVRGEVFYTVYLPPGWTVEGSESYPLIFFLHGQSGDEYRFSDNVPVSQLNQWVNEGLVPPFVLVAPRGSDIPNSVQWYYSQNVTLLTSEAPDELRAFCWETFRAGGSPSRISVQGQSRGASGTLFFALNHWGRFASAVANAFVSDYVLEDYMEDATANRNAIVASGIPLRMTIGTEDSYVVDEGRVGSEALHQHLLELGIPHEYEVLPGVTHAFSSLWHYVRPDGLVTGLYELQYHARAWATGP